MKTMFLVMAAVVIAPLAAQAAEKKIPQSQVPKPVIDAVAKKYPTAKIKGFEVDEEEGKKTYEASIDAGKGAMDVELTAEGKILAEESKLPATALPAAIKAGITASKYKGWKIKGAELVIKEEKTAEPFYEVVFTQKQAKVEVVFDKGGAITKEEVKDAKDKD
jgi:hypothetical protein